MKPLVLFDEKLKKMETKDATSFDNTKKIKRELNTIFMLCNFENEDPKQYENFRLLKICFYLDF